MGAKFSAPVQTRPVVHPTFCTMGTGSFPGGKERPGRDADPSPPSSAVGHERVEQLFDPFDLLFTFDSFCYGSSLVVVPEVVLHFVSNFLCISLPSFYVMNPVLLPNTLIFYAYLCLHST